ncbi:MAG: ABC transporter permease [Planctomycetota bacterium]|nr:ABC transporter permease [Planctomycetota bacterium]MDP6763300.1 ABC transporter permease [Planctomycetota bacterium]MDP6987978.1 ABC transporter permease [Planctomycetota bacterium]
MRALFLIVRRSLRQHALSTAVTVASLALACGLVTAIFSIERQARGAFGGGSGSFDAVLGARGSQLQLVLNAVFHLETSPGNVPWSLYERVAADPRVAAAVPYAVGDSYRGHRIVGTVPDAFALSHGGEARFVGAGRLFDPGRREAVIGSAVARRTGLAYGAHFQPAHGVIEAGAHDHDEDFVVVGVLEPTNTPADRVVWIPIEAVFRMGGHVLRGGGEDYHADPSQPIPDEHKEVSAVLLQLKGGMMGASLFREINYQQKEATLAWPVARVMAELFDKLGWMHRVLTMVAYLVVAVATGSVTASLYNTMNERRREFAILRSLGARRRTVFAAIVCESSAIAFAGGLAGLVVHAAILAGASALVRERTGVVLEVFAAHPVLWLAPAGLVALGALAGVVPALKAYRTDVATHLAPTS